jgi:crotonobetaine/carnitine-CoA ligase
MIRRSSENIAAREVEAVLCTLPNIIDAAALAEPDLVRGEEVLAVIQLAPGAAAPPVEDLMQALEGRLAAFKRPRYWSFVSEFPRTASNKAQKPRLREAISGSRAFDVRQGAWIILD